MIEISGNSDISNTWVKYAIILKMSRGLNINIYFNRIQYILIYTTLKDLIKLKILRNFILLFIFIHVSSCTWLFTTALESIESNPYYIRKEIVDHPNIFKYIVSVEVKFYK